MLTKGYWLVLTPRDFKSIFFRTDKGVKNKRKNNESENKFANCPQCNSNEIVFIKKQYCVNKPTFGKEKIVEEKYGDYLIIFEEHVCSLCGNGWSNISTKIATNSRDLH